MTNVHIKGTATLPSALQVYLARPTCVCACVVPLAIYFIMHIQTMHPKTHRATYILARGLMNAENPVGP